jgi:hypothetical protein
MLALIAAINLPTVQPLIAADNLVVAEQSAATSAPRPIMDLKLDAEGQMHGRVTDASSAAVGDAQVIVYRGLQPVAQTVADESGRFTVPNLASGVYHFECRTAADELGQADYRLWTQGAAPPAAVDNAQLRSQPMIVRGQHPPSSIWCFLTTPWVTAAILTAAIAVPIAVTNNDDSAS